MPKFDAVAVSLSAPIEAHGETLEALSLRPPTGADLRAMGMPFTLTGDGGVQMDGKGMHRAIAHLGAIPPSSVDKLSAGDFMAAAGVILGFFGEAPPAS